MANRLNDLRVKMHGEGVPQYKLAKIMGINPTRLNYILMGRKEPPPGFQEEALEAINSITQENRV